MCIAIEYADAPPVVTWRSADRNGNRAICGKRAAAAAIAAVPCTKFRLDNPDPVLAGGPAGA
jgi:hypothetical protein